MDPDSTVPCQRCGALVTADELGLGLAVRINGEIICPLCVDTLPTAAQLSINQVRAMKGLSAVTYTVTDARVKIGRLFSFSTAGMINQHRRALANHQLFAAPPLPAKVPASEAPTIAAEKPVSEKIEKVVRERGSSAIRKSQPKPPDKPVLAPTQPPRPDQTRTLAIRVGLGLGLLTVGSLAWVLLTDHTSPPSPPKPAITPTATDGAPVPTQGPTRATYPADPLQAWAKAKADPTCPGEVMKAIDDEVRRALNLRFDLIDAAITEGRLNDARTLFAETLIPNSGDFRDINDRAAATRLRLAAARQDALFKPPPTPQQTPPQPPQTPPPAPAQLPGQPPVPPVSAPTNPPTAVATPPEPPITAPVTKPPEDLKLPPMVPKVEVGTVEAWVPSVSGQRPEPLDGSVTLPSPWPAGMGVFHRSRAGVADRHALTIEIPTAKTLGGGVVLALHRAYPKRQGLNVRVIAPGGKTALPLAALTFDADASWQVFAIALPQVVAAGGPPGAPPPVTLTLRLDDVDRFPSDRGFLLGNVVLVAGHAPAVRDLPLLPSPLIAGDVVADERWRAALTARLNEITPRRRMRAGRVSLDPGQVCVVGELPEQWQPLRDATARALGTRPEQIPTSRLAYAATMWETFQFKPEVAPIDNAVTSLVALVSDRAGGFDRIDEVLAWAQQQRKAIMQGNPMKVRGGMLPVLAIGPAVAAPGTDPALYLGAWAKVRQEWLTQGLPLIDLTPAQGAGTDEAIAVRAGERLGQGLRQFAWQVNWLLKTQ